MTSRWTSTRWSRCLTKRSPIRWRWKPCLQRFDLSFAASTDPTPRSDRLLPSLRRGKFPGARRRGFWGGRPVNPRGQGSRRRILRQGASPSHAIGRRSRLPSCRAKVVDGKWGSARWSSTTLRHFRTNVKTGVRVFTSESERPGREHDPAVGRRCSETSSCLQS
jgi:hypothetical protein